MTDKNLTRISKELLESVVLEQAEFFENKDLGVKRQLLNEIKETVESPHITVISGLRRVGKSTLLAQIAEKYFKKSYYFVSFEDERLINFKVEDFDLLYETLITVFGEKRIFLFDEIQNVEGWERFVRRMHDKGCKLIVTGSNASLLSQELGTRLTGRYIKVELFPFSFKEFLTFKNINLEKNFWNKTTTKDKGNLSSLVNEYLTLGGIPDALKYPELPIHKSLYDDVLYRDIATRYGIENLKSLKELSFLLVSNISALVSFNKIKDLLKLGSVNTVKSYIDYLENSWLFFVVNKYAYSVKEQQIASKKIYCIDTGIFNSVGFSFSENKGKSLENIVFIQLRKKYFDNVFYYKTAENYEVDFFVPKDGLLIQVAQKFDDEETKTREIRSLIAASKENKKIKKFLLITENKREILKIDNVVIEVMPIYEFLFS